jgi:D-alanine-D-alanine ligase
MRSRMAKQHVVILVNTDFESRRHELTVEGPRAYEADAAVLDTARSVEGALTGLGYETSWLEVKASLAGVVPELCRRKAKVVFNLVESIDNDYGREWQVPALLEKHGLCYTGNRALPLRLCRKKDRARGVLLRAGLGVAPGVVLKGPGELSQERLKRLRFPLFVKPARVDGSIGIDRHSICQDAKALARRVEALAASLPGPYLVEEFLPGKEINVALFPSPARGFVVPTEIDFSSVPAEYPRIVTYDGKWNDESPEFASKSVPAVLDAATRAAVCQLARAAFAALGGSAYGRVDMRLDGQGRPAVIDVNPNNDIHQDAGLSAAARSVGVDYPALIASVVAVARQSARARGRAQPGART